ncbi:hypothetical protein HDU97_009646 [Phlyctochytrium planicorne]|nr:hypothetical protein HDU97_009646 [Phlyctochytrium planicorne]
MEGPTSASSVASPSPSMASSSPAIDASSSSNRKLSKGEKIVGGKLLKLSTALPPLPQLLNRSSSQQSVHKRRKKRVRPRVKFPSALKPSKYFARRLSNSSVNEEDNEEDEEEEEFRKEELLLQEQVLERSLPVQTLSLGNEGGAANLVAGLANVTENAKSDSMSKAFGRSDSEGVNVAEIMQLSSTSSTQPQEAHIAIPTHQHHHFPSSIPVLSHPIQITPSIISQPAIPTIPPILATEVANKKPRGIDLSSFFPAPHKDSGVAQSLAAQSLQRLAEEIRKRWQQISENPDVDENLSGATEDEFPETLGTGFYDIEGYHIDETVEKILSAAPANTSPLRSMIVAGGLPAAQANRQIVGANVWKSSTTIASNQSPSPQPSHQSASTNPASNAGTINQKRAAPLHTPSFTPPPLLIPLHHYPYMRNLPPSIPTSKSVNRNYLLPSGVSGGSIRPNGASRAIATAKTGVEMGDPPTTPIVELPQLRGMTPEGRKSVTMYTYPPPLESGMEQHSMPTFGAAVGYRTPPPRTPSSVSFGRTVPSRPPSVPTSMPTTQGHSGIGKREKDFKWGGRIMAAIPPSAPLLSLTTAAGLFLTRNSHHKGGRRKKDRTAATVFAGGENVDVGPSVYMYNPAVLPSVAAALFTADHAGFSQARPQHLHQQQQNSTPKLPPINPAQTFLSLSPTPSTGTLVGGAGKEMYWRMNGGVDRKTATTVGVVAEERSSVTLGSMEVKLGSLGPDLTGDEYMAKVTFSNNGEDLIILPEQLQKLNRQRQYAESIRHRNLQTMKRSPSPAHSTPTPAVDGQRSSSGQKQNIRPPSTRPLKLQPRIPPPSKDLEEATIRRAKVRSFLSQPFLNSSFQMLQYASKIKKPLPAVKLPPMNQSEPSPNRKNAVGKYEEESWGDSGDERELGRLEAEHERSRGVVVGIKKDLRME